MSRALRWAFAARFASQDDGLAGQKNTLVPFCMRPLSRHVIWHAGCAWGEAGSENGASGDDWAVVSGDITGPVARFPQISGPNTWPTEGALSTQKQNPSMPRFHFYVQQIPTSLKNLELGIGVCSQEIDIAFEFTSSKSPLLKLSTLHALTFSRVAYTRLPKPILGRASVDNVKKVLE